VNDSIGHKLKTLRKGRKLTQEKAAEMLGITRATVSNYEVGRRSPHITELKRIADFYGVGLDYFGIVPTDEVFDLISRAREVFQSDDVPKEKKDELYVELMRLYLSIQ
jgi:transcriptional regulator with XRE-family HTH domain